jgi:ubiquinone/menaquinone biosynthesis C-methylase UbiE
LAFVTQRSLSFDRAATFYDATRALDPDVARRLTDALEREIRPAGSRVLEPGIGTGRIARPLAERGIRVTGADISHLMMEHLLAQLTPHHAPPDLVLADATFLPFADACFPAVMACHLLHLIPDWRQAIGEMRRVLRPGGVIILHSETNTDRTRPERWTAKWDELLSRHNFRRRRRPEREDFREAFRDIGGHLRTEIIAEWEEHQPLAEYLEEVRNRVHSWTWEIPEDIFEASFDEFAEWALAKMASERGVVYEMDVWTFD